jgi:hypothetical protein
MPYTDRFRATDNLIAHLITVIGSIADPEIKSNYAGFVAVCSVTAYELAIKDIFKEFASKKNKVFGTVVEKHFGRINGAIKLDDLRGKHIKLFGGIYLNKFNKTLLNKEASILATSRISISTDYGNLITCRHEYVHKGYPTLTIEEVIEDFESGKEIIHCLNMAMKR